MGKTEQLLLLQMGGVALHEGRIAEMHTGEGKTLVATLPVYLHALLGMGVHLVTVNAYLAGRDADWYMLHLSLHTEQSAHSAARTQATCAG